MSSADTSVTREVEAKFRVHPPFQLPPLADPRSGVASVDAAVVAELRAVYWDTSDLRLAREGITLRHRSGEGEDKDGWHLKLPVSEGRVPDASTASRDEVRATGDSETVPSTLRDLVTVWVRTAVLGPVATLVTNRSTCVLRDEVGTPLVEVTDDLVSVLSSGHVAGRFREIEVEDLGGGVPVITAISSVLRAGGAVGGEFVPKVIRALGPQATADPDPPLPRPTSVDAPVRCLVRDVLRRYTRQLMAADVAARRQQDDAVHQIRVAARRLRGVLKTFHPLLDEEWASSLREELRWLADSMGAARDGEVLLERLLGDLDRLPPELVLGPVRARIEQVVGGDLVRGNAQVMAALRSERHLVLLERLVDAAWEPMTSPRAEQPARIVVPHVLRKAWRRLARDAQRLEHEEATVHDWHQVRIDAKLLRYACEAVEPMFGKPARVLAKQAEAVQDLLGEHQDAVIAESVLRGIATAPKAGPVAFTLGLLHARQQEAAARCRSRFWPVWAEVSRSRHRRWLAT